MRRLLALATVAALAACARPSAPPAAAPSGRASVGYVHMDELVKVHPLYGQLARYDDNIEALNLSALVPHALAAGPELKREEAALNAQLQAAAKRTDDLIAAKSKAYQERENAAIAAALRQAGTPGGAGVAAVAGQMESTARNQQSGAAMQAQRNLDIYRNELQAQDLAQIEAAQKTLAARADRTYRAKADELNAKEAALSLQLATDSASQRLSLRTKLSSLALDDAQRDDVNRQIAALDQKAADAMGAQHNRDMQILAALQAQLRAGVQSDMERQAAQIHNRSLGHYRAREKQLQADFRAPAGPLLGNGPASAPGFQVNPNLPADLRARIQKLHDDYQAAFTADAKATVADFNKTRDDLSKRYAQLNGTDVEAARSAQREIEGLQQKRSDLYRQMVAEIDREVTTLAQQRGISVVVSDVAAPAGGVDLTGDAMKDIETLHE